MKRIFLLLLLPVILSSCFSSSQVEEAKKEMLENENISDINVVNDVEQQPNTQKNSSVTENSNSVTIVSVTTEQFLQVDPIMLSDIEDGEVTISWKTLVDVDKIDVIFSNQSSEFPDDDYTLKTFSAGSDTFRYVASSKFQVLDFWKNIYTIKAYSGKEVSETQVVIYVAEQKDTTITYQEKVIGTEDNSVVIDLPQSELFGTPISLWTSSFTYSGIEGLEIKKQEVTDITCENITTSLESSINSWFYWNTCRDIIKEKGISFYVIKLTEEDTYVYQKHYVDYVHGFYAILDIETGTGVDKDNISEKNTQYKENNDTFSWVSIVDTLMREIVSSN